MKRPDQTSLAIGELTIVNTFEKPSGRTGYVTLKQRTDKEGHPNGRWYVAGSGEAANGPLASMLGQQVRGRGGY